MEGCINEAFMLAKLCCMQHVSMNNSNNNRAYGLTFELPINAPLIRHSQHSVLCKLL